jgi:hypothetical protein
VRFLIGGIKVLVARGNKTTVPQRRIRINCFNPHIGADSGFISHFKHLAFWSATDLVEASATRHSQAAGYPAGHRA